MSYAPRLGLVLLVATLGLVRPVRGQGSSGTDTTVVASGGQWADSGLTGTYRVSVTTAGFEHVASSVRLEWIRRQGRRNVVVAAMDSTLPIPDRMYSLGKPEFIHSTEGWSLKICGTHSYELTNGCWLLLLGRPGEIKSSGFVY